MPQHAFMLALLLNSACSCTPVKYFTYLVFLCSQYLDFYCPKTDLSRVVNRSAGEWHVHISRMNQIFHKVLIPAQGSQFRPYSLQNILQYSRRGSLINSTPWRVRFVPSVVDCNSHTAMWKHKPLCVALQPHSHLKIAAWSQLYN